LQPCKRINRRVWSKLVQPWCSSEYNVKGKGKGLPYSILSVGPRADPGVHAISPQVTRSHPLGGRLPLLSTRPAVTFPATEHHRPLAGTKLYCLVTEAHRCEQLAQGCYAAFLPSRIWTHDLLIASPTLYPLRLASPIVKHDKQHNHNVYLGCYWLIYPRSGWNHTDHPTKLSKTAAGLTYKCIFICKLWHKRSDMDHTVYLQITPCLTFLH